MRMPTVGDRVRVTGSWQGKHVNVTGVVLAASPEHRYRPQYQTDEGHWRAKIHTDSGVDFEVPWSAKILKFEVLT